ncbi:hypothetical protein ACFYY8_21350 [Streptosporangium sp. NPDC001559]|uniref:hypothetical protein n=1 Tax=Streptosporangium sp. NPDC001559 TaxID=3366187 RepID=UPI0036E810BC
MKAVSPERKNVRVRPQIPSPGRHRLFLAVLLVAVALRVLTVMGYSPVVWFEDSFDYVGVAERPQPYEVRPSGYSLLLWLLRPLHSFAAVAILQHLMGLATGTAIYALVRRRAAGARTGWAVLAAAPVLLDVYQIFFEHTILSDVPFTFLVVTAVAVVLWTPGVTPGRVAAAGLLLAAAALTRSIGLVLLPLLAAYLLVARAGVRALLTALVAVAIPLGGYAAWYGAWHGTPALNGGNGVWLWARTMPFADCRRIRPPQEEAVLCPSQPVGSRPASPYFIWSDWSPLRRVPGHPVVTRADLFQPRIDALAGDLARRAVIAQPLDYLRVVGEDLRRTLSWRRGPVPGAVPVVYNRYVLPNTEGPLPDGVRIPGGGIRADLLAYGRGRPETRVVEPAAGVMRAYQAFGFLPGPLFGVLAAGALLACAVRLIPNTRTQGLRTWRVWIRGVRTQDVQPRSVESRDAQSRDVRSRRVWSLDVRSRFARSPDVPRPGILGPGVQSLGVPRPGILGPGVQSLGVQSPESQSSDIAGSVTPGLDTRGTETQNPETQNPEARSSEACRRTTPAGVLPLAMAFALIVGPVAVTAYDSRYWLPAVPLLCLALSLTLTERRPRTVPGEGHDGP